MPFFDSKVNPSSIAVPFKAYSLRNIESKSAAYIVVKYYETVIKCLTIRNANQTDFIRFNNNVYSWLHGEVLYHLNDEKFYSAFGGVLRIDSALRKMGILTYFTKNYYFNLP